VQYTRTPLFRNGLAAGWVVTFLDRTVQQQMDVERESVAAISHDLRNPLASIKGLAQLMRRQLAEVDRVDPSSVLQRVARIDEAATRMAAQVDELLDVSRLELGRPLELHVHAVDVVSLARGVIAAHLEASERRNITLEFAQATLMLAADPVRLRRVLDNLVSNALKYTPPSGEVVVRVYAEHVETERWAVVEVIDTGIGIPSDDLPHLFERFFRGRNVAVDAPGLGLGLATVRQLVEAHGGAVTVSSCEGRGSRFSVRLPIARA
jgi:two-component system sensor histidine kinase BaeS